MHLYRHTAIIKTTEGEVPEQDFSWPDALDWVSNTEINNMNIVHIAQ